VAEPEGSFGTKDHQELTWPTLKAGTPYLGIVDYSTGDRTFVHVD
jgi:hypothetical protein